MAKFYTVDRHGSLRKGLIVQLQRYTDVNPPELQAHVDHLFPDGVSSHGEYYFLKNSSHPKLASPNIEVLFEYVRRAFYPHRPSRFQSFFAFQHMSEAEAFRNAYGDPANRIWLAEAPVAFVADMRLLTTGTSILVYSYFAHKYWEGEASPDPIWECLLLPPVRVVAEYHHANP
jgi:hypothetical protein